jgi:hypothetical protein
MKRNQRRIGPTSSEQQNDFQAEVIRDLTSIQIQWNDVIVPLLKRLPKGDDDSTVNAFNIGLDGTTLYTNSEVSPDLMDGTFYHESKDRPLTVFEQFLDVYNYINDQIETLSERSVGPAGPAGATGPAGDPTTVADGAIPISKLAAAPELVSNKGQANGYAGLDSDSQVPLSQIVLSTSDCGSGVDGDLDISTPYFMTRDMRFRRLRLLPGGSITTDTSSNAAGGWVLRAQILDLTNADPYCIKGKFNGTTVSGAGTSAGVAGTNGSAAAFYTGTAGSSIRNATGGAGGTAAGVAGTVAPTTTNSVGGYVRLAGGSGGAGSSGAGGAGGGAGTGAPGIEPTVPSEPALAWGTSATAGGSALIASGGSPGAGGGGGGGDGTIGAGGGAGGIGGKPLDIRVGRLIVSPSTGLPIVDGRGGIGGAGGPSSGGNRGGGGGGSGGCGTRIHFSVGEISLTGGATLPLVNALDASGGAGGNGGAGTGTGVGGGGGGGGSGGAIYYRRRGATILDLDDRANIGTAGTTASGNTPGVGGAGRTTLANIS